MEPWSLLGSVIDVIKNIKDIKGTREETLWNI